EISILAGRSFSSEDAMKGYDSRRLMLNETAAKRLHFDDPTQAVGQTIKWGDSSWEVIGVFKDYNHTSLHTPVDPIVFIPGRNSGYFTLNINTTDFPFKKAQLALLYGEVFPGNPFEYEFLDETYAKLYETEQKLGKLFTIASLLAVFISALGLLGLANFVAKQKTKEIGIRKVLGATVSSIIQLLSADFLKLVLLSFFLAAPVAWYVMENWLKNFAYRIDIPWWVFTLAGFGTALLAFITVSIQSLRVAYANPIESLRNE
ncbi:MAG: FtsX-like permease family protein, partial [Bacteroidota bacterium]